MTATSDHEGTPEMPETFPLPPLSDPGTTLNRAYAFSINNESGLVVQIDYEGNVEFGEGVTPDEASRAFYQSVTDLALTDKANDAIRGALARGRERKADSA